jgi:hypothetical protein
LIGGFGHEQEAPVIAQREETANNKSRSKLPATTRSGARPAVETVRSEPQSSVAG